MPITTTDKNKDMTRFSLSNLKKAGPFPLLTVAPINVKIFRRDPASTSPSHAKAPDCSARLSRMRRDHPRSLISHRVTMQFVHGRVINLLRVAEIGLTGKKPIGEGEACDYKH
jgi:hypothetical protein